ncbi:baseplate J/gp47 family protein [Stutzerimonas kunmingensis]|uniref:baseplate J/gp47 family protein n=1 Tax=Stutzerimonas kunmingensis TaxID=1211807 RepID=UPI00241E1B02|nr:baseplate J/gp47 family protein [Stutzerimonas kunmingensis]
MSGFTAIDLPQLPAPQIIEALDYETILAERKAYLVSLYPVDEQAAIAARLELESEPMTKLLQENAYRELTLRQRINDAARGVMLAYATGSDLDQIGANFSIQRLVVEAGDPTAVPPVAPIHETDADFRRRIQLGFEGFSTAGPEGAYLFHALGADGRVLDAGVYGPPESPGVVRVAVLSREGSGHATEDLLEAVQTTLRDDDVRPLTDHVLVESAEVLEYQVTASLTFYPGPDKSVVLAAAHAALTAYTQANHRLGRDVTLSGLYAALHREGVQNVTVSSPLANVIAGWNQATWCTGIDLLEGGTDE